MSFVFLATASVFHKSSAFSLRLPVKYPLLEGLRFLFCFSDFLRSQIINGLPLSKLLWIIPEK